jgi:hypothetical protein
MRTLFLFALTLAGTACLADDASAFGRRGHRVEAYDCCSSTGVVGAGPVYSAQTGTPYVPIQGSGPAYNPYYYPNGGIYPAGYNPTVYPGNGKIPAPGLIDLKSEAPSTPRKVLNPMPGK